MTKQPDKRKIWEGAWISKAHTWQLGILYDDKADLEAYANEHKPGKGEWRLELTEVDAFKCSDGIYRRYHHYIVFEDGYEAGVEADKDN